jgi:hypothetical protein
LGTQWIIGGASTRNKRDLVTRLGSIRRWRKPAREDCGRHEAAHSALRFRHHFAEERRFPDFPRE